MGKTLPKYRKLFESLKKAGPHRVYFLYGPEEYLKREFIRGLLDAVLPAENRAFNLDILYGDEFDKSLFDDRIGSFPLFTERRVVILRNFKDLSLAHKDHVIAAVAKVPDSVVLIVETPNEKLDNVRLKNMRSAADGSGMSFNFEYLDEQETMERVTARFKRDGYSVTPDALSLLVESVGVQLIDLINEVEKICLTAGDEKTVDREMVAAVVGKYRSEDLFSLLRALEEKDSASMIRKLDRLIDGGEQPVVMLGMLLNRVALLMEVKAILDERGKNAPTGRALAAEMSGAISPFYADALLGQARRFERDELILLLANLRWADFKLKTTQLPPKHLIEEAFLASRLGKTLAYAGEIL